MISCFPLSEGLSCVADTNIYLADRLTPRLPRVQPRRAFANEQLTAEDEAITMLPSPDSAIIMPTPPHEMKEFLSASWRHATPGAVGRFSSSQGARCPQLAQSVDIIMVGVSVGAYGGRKRTRKPGEDLSKCSAGDRLVDLRRRRFRGCGDNLTVKGLTWCPQSDRQGSRRIRTPLVFHVGNDTPDRGE